MCDRRPKHNETFVKKINAGYFGYILGIKYLSSGIKVSRIGSVWS